MNAKTKNTIGWIAQVLMAAGFLYYAYPKLLGVEVAVQNFQRWGYPDGFHYLIGAVELIGAIMLLSPKYAGYGALLLLGAMGGAVITHLINDEAGAIVIPLAFSLVLGVVLWARTPSFLKKGSA